jgi:hypothetical protein
LYSGDYAGFTREKAQRIPVEFKTSCKLMEIVANGNSIILDKKNMRNATSPDGTLYTERSLILRIKFMGGFFIKIEQRREYPGKFK